MGESQNQSSRRGFLQASLASAGALALASKSLGQDHIGGRIQPGPIDVQRGPSRYSLIERTSYGLTPESMQRFDELGYTDFLEEQLNPHLIDDSACTARLRQFQALDASPYQCLKVLEVDEDWECVQSQIVRATYSKRQLQEIMVEFWLDHFNCYIYNSMSELWPTHVATIRKYAFSNFHTLLVNVVKSCQTMAYLDNLSNVKGFMNQNFPRELLELHTMGVDGGYTERDVATVTRVFTGWGMEGYYEWPWENTTNPNWGRFRFYPDKHDRSGGQFLGDLPDHLIPVGDVEQGETVLQRLAVHPSTAWNIARKLCRKFYSYEPTYNQIEAAANSYLSSSGNIRKVLRTILSESRFPRAFKPKFKRPYHYTISALRVMRAEMTDADSIIWELLNNMRQIPLHWAPPNGYPDAMNLWVENLRPRWYMGFQLPMNWLWNARTDIFALGKVRTKEVVVSDINRNLFGGSLRQERIRQLLSTMSNTPSNTQIREAYSLALAGPEFQMY